MQAPKVSKKIYLVNRDFQLRYTGVAVGVGFITTILTVIVILFPLYSFEILRIPRFLPMPIMFAMGAVLIVNVGSLCFMGIMVTHRIAGPMYAIVRHLRRMTAGKFNLVTKIREEDELGYVVRNLNDLTESLQTRTKLEIHRISEVSAHLAKLEASNPDVAAIKLYLMERDEALNKFLDASDGDDDA